MAPPARAAGWLLGGGLAVVLLAVVLLGGPSNDGPPLDPRSDGPLGTSALVALLDGLGATVDLSAGAARRPPTTWPCSSSIGWTRGRPTRSSPGSGRAARSWCSIRAPRWRPDAPASNRWRRTTSAEGCARWRRWSTSAGSTPVPGLVSTPTGPTDRASAAETSRFVVAGSLGAGHVVAVGGPAFATNERLGHHDNAVLAAALLAPVAGRTVRFVDPPIPAGGGDKSLYELVSDGVRRAGLQLGLAFLLYAAWRAIRLGRPVAEPQPVEIAGAELVVAAGHLLERGRSPGGAAEVLRAHLRDRVQARLGLPTATSPAQLAELLVERFGVDREQALAAVGDHAVTTDAELVVVSQAAAHIHQEVLR